MATLSEKDRMTLLFWQIAHVDVGRPLRWAQSLKRAIDVLISPSPNEEAAALFWIRLHGVLHQFLERYQPSPGAATATDPEVEFFNDLAVEVFAACTQLMNAFTSNELLAIQWIRDFESHPALTAYDLKERNGQLKRDGKHALTGEIPVPHADVHAAVRAVRNGRDDVSVAAALAGRAAPHVDNLIVALEAFPKP